MDRQNTFYYCACLQLGNEVRQGGQGPKSAP